MICLCFWNSINSLRIRQFIHRSVTNDLDLGILAVNQLLSEYTSVYNTYHKGSDDYIRKTVIYM